MFILLFILSMIAMAIRGCLGWDRSRWYVVIDRAAKRRRLWAWHPGTSAGDDVWPLGNAATDPGQDANAICEGVHVIVPGVRLAVSYAVEFPVKARLVLDVQNRAAFERALDNNATVWDAHARYATVVEYLAATLSVTTSVRADEFAELVYDAAAVQTRCIEQFVRPKLASMGLELVKVDTSQIDMLPARLEAMRAAAMSAAMAQQAKQPQPATRAAANTNASVGRSFSVRSRSPSPSPSPSPAPAQPQPQPLSGRRTLQHASRIDPMRTPYLTRARSCKT